MFKKLLLVAWVCVALFLVNCKGDDGAVGPKGDTGATGPAGPTGPAGASDTTSGSAGSVIYSFGEVTADSGSYVFGFDGLTADDEEFLDASTIQVFAKSGGLWWPLPGNVEFDNAVSTFNYAYGIQDSQFLVYMYSTNWSEDQDTAPTRTLEDLRLVLIPGVVRNVRTNSNVNWKDYNQTITALGLNETNVKKLNYSAKQGYKKLLASKFVK